MKPGDKQSNIKNSTPGGTRPAEPPQGNRGKQQMSPSAQAQGTKKSSSSSDKKK